MPIAVQGYTVRSRVFNGGQVEEAYRKFAEMGYDGVEAGMGGRHMSDEEDAALLAKHGLKAAAAYGDVTRPDEAMRRAECFGVRLLGLPSIPGEMMGSADGFLVYADRINQWAAPFRGTGFRLQYHNHAQEFRNFPSLSGKSGMALLIENTDPVTVAFELDTHWMAAAGCDSAEWIRKVSGRIPCVHFKDYAINPLAEDTGLGHVPKLYAEIGQGNLNWPAIRDACADAGVHWYCVEQDRSERDVFESLRISINYMRNLGIR